MGNWTDIPAGGGGEPGATKPRAVMHMGLHYAGDKVSRSFIVKAHVLKVFMSLFRRRQGEFALDEQGLLIRGSWEWPEVSAMFELYKAEFEEVQPPDPLPAPSSSLEEDKDLVVLDVVPALALSYQWSTQSWPKTEMLRIRRIAVLWQTVILHSPHQTSLLKATTCWT